MALNLDKLMKRMGNPQVKAHTELKDRGGDLHYISTANIQDGQTIAFRMYPSHLTKNPDGHVYQRFHKIQTDPNRKPELVFCPKMNDETAPCFACECLDVYQDNKENPEFNAIPVYEALQDLIGYEVYMFYTGWKAEPVKIIEEGEEKTVYISGSSDYKPSIFKVYSPTILNRIQEIAKLAPLYDDPNQGLDLLFKKNWTKYSIDTLNPSPLNAREREQLTEKSYPNLKIFGEKKRKKDNIWIETTIKQSFWYPLCFSDESDE